MKRIGIVFLLLLVLSCSREQREIRTTLRMAGSNRPELEAVLKHYAASGDREKEKAAKYLIRNMPRHMSYQGDFEAYGSLVDSLLPLMGSAKEFNRGMRVIADSLKGGFKLRSDARIITSDFLITSIEEAFQLWKNGRWAAHLSLDEFCEYVLPYKVEEFQPVEEWRKEYQGLFSGPELIVDDAVDEYRGEPHLGLQNIRGKAIGHVLAYSDSLESTDLYDLRVIKDVPYGDCISLCNLGLLLYRSKGLPVAMDYVPGWADRAGSHAWLSVLTRRGVNRPVHAFSDGNPEDEVQCRRFAKVYRRTFRPNKELDHRMKLGYPIPAHLSDIFFKDVTEEYVRCEDVKTKVRRGVSGRNVYVAVFDNQQWVPIAYGERKGLGTVVFKKLARNALYMPVVLKKNGEQVTVGDPFIIHSDGRVESILTKKHPQKKSTLTMKRKYPVYWLLAAVYDRTRGGCIQGSESPDFRFSETIAQIPNTKAWSCYLSVSGQKSYRYYRICAPTGRACDVGEIKLFDEQEELKAVSVFYPTGKANATPDKDPSLVIDNDALTWVTTDDTQSLWIGLDYGKPKTVTGLFYSVRSDGNDFYPGYEYVLRQWNGKNWEKVETFVATKEVEHQFKELIEGTLYLVTCNTTGTQSRPFVVKDGQPFWM